MLRRIHWFVLAPLALLVAAACGKVSPPTGQLDDAGICEVPTQAEACAGKCGELIVCETSFSCGDDCAGELSCGAQTTNTCGCASPPCAIGSFTAGDASAQTIVDIAVDANGNVFVAGNFRGTVTFGAASYTNPGAVRPDMFLVKLNPAGEVLWSKAYGDSGATDTDQHVNGIDVDATGNLVLVGHSSGSTNLGGANLAAANDMVIVKLDTDGTHLFSASYGSEFAMEAFAMSVDPASQDIIVAGKFWGTVQFGGLASMTAVGTNADHDIFVVRIAANGTPTASKRFGDGAEQIVESLAISGSHVYLAAYFRGMYDYGAPSPTTVTSATFYSLALTKLTLTGLLHGGWTKQYGSEVFGTQIAADVNGNVFLGGSFGATLDIVSPSLDSAAGDTFVAKVDANGNSVWGKQFANLNITAVTVDAAGAFYVVGYVNGAVDLGGGLVAFSGSNDPFIANYASDGTHVWSRVFSAPVGTLQRATSIDVATDGTMWVGHNYDGTIDLGLGPVTTKGATDIAVMAYVP